MRLGPSTSPPSGTGRTSPAGPTAWAWRPGSACTVAPRASCSSASRSPRLEERDGWSLVRALWQASATHPGGYPGWVRTAHLAEPVPVREGPTAYVTARTARLDDATTLSCGTVLWVAGTEDCARGGPPAGRADRTARRHGRAPVHQGRPAVVRRRAAARPGPAAPRTALPVGRHECLGAGLLRAGAPDPALVRRGAPPRRARAGHLRAGRPGAPRPGAAGRPLLLRPTRTGGAPRRAS